MPASNPPLYEKLANPAVLAAIKELGAFCYRSNLFGLDSEDQGVVMALACVAGEITPVEFGRTYRLVAGGLAMRADAMQAKFLEAGGRVEWLRSDAAACEARFTHPEHAPQGVVVAVTLAELAAAGVAASAAGILKTSYRRHPRQMLRARVVSEGVRMLMPGLVAGCYTPEETSDFDPPPSAPPPPLLAPAPAPDLDLADIEDDANAYLRRLRWIAPEETWRQLRDAQKRTIQVRLSSFREQARRFAAAAQEIPHAV